MNEYNQEFALAYSQQTRTAKRKMIRKTSDKFLEWEWEAMNDLSLSIEEKEIGFYI